MKDSLHQRRRGLWREGGKRWSAGAFKQALSNLWPQHFREDTNSQANIGH